MSLRPTGDTAEDMEKAEKLVSINDYMSDEEMAEYVDDYMKDGSLHDHAYVNIFPIAKQRRSWLSIRTYGMNLRKRKM